MELLLQLIPLFPLTLVIASGVLLLLVILRVILKVILEFLMNDNW